MRGEVDLIYEHPGGGRLYLSGLQAVPDDPAQLGISLLVVAAKQYVRRESHPNVILTPFEDEEDLPGWRWAQIERMVIPAVEAMAAALQAGEGVLCVCRAGINRSALLCALVLNAVSGRSPQQVVALIRERRDPSCLSNQDFLNVALHGF